MISEKKLEKFEAFKKKLQSEEMYFMNSHEDAVIKSVPGKNGGYWVKFRGAAAFAATGDNTVVTDGILEAKEVSKATFDKH